LKRYSTSLLFLLALCSSWLVAEDLAGYAVSRIEERVVRGNSLSPLVEPGTTVKVIFGYYQDKQIQRGDIIAYNHPGHSSPLAKIVRGVPGDKFELRQVENGYNVVMLNGEVLKNSSGQKYEFTGNKQKMLSLYEKDYHGVIPENTYLLLGDLPGGSLDSTRFGLVDKSGIIGKIEKVEKSVEAASEPQITRPLEIDLFISPFSRLSISLEDMIMVVADRFSDRVKINMYYYVQKSTYGARTNEPLKRFRTPRGENEIKETIRQIVILNNYPDKFWDYLRVRNLNIYNPDWIPYAETAGFSKDEIRNIKDQMFSENTFEILAGMAEKTKQINLKRIPTLFIDGKVYENAMEVFEIVSYINSQISEEKRLEGVREWKEVEREPVKVTAVINPDGWGRDTRKMRESFERIFGEIEFQEIDYRTKDGRRLIERYELDLLPAYLVKKPKKKNGNKKIEDLVEQGFFVQKDNYYVMPSTVSKLGLYINRPSKRKKLDIFLMSYCPWGTKAANQVIDILKRNQGPDKVEIKFHYILSLNSEKTPENFGDFRSLHGLGEVEEAARQLIIQKYFPDKIFDYVVERNKQISSTLYYHAFHKTGIPEDFVRLKMETEGVELLLRNIDFVKEFGITASPTFLWENRYMVDYEGLKMIPGFGAMKIEGKCE